MDFMPRAIAGMLRPVTFVFLAACCGASAARAADALQEGFLTPPDASRPFVFWFWLDGNVTREGITADLEPCAVRDWAGRSGCGAAAAARA
jgi:hypothetical protein